MWKKKNGEYYLYDSIARLLADFAISAVHKISRVMYFNRFTNSPKEFELLSGDVKEAKTIIEEEIIDYCNKEISFYRDIRDDVLHPY